MCRFMIIHTFIRVCTHVPPQWPISPQTENFASESATPAPRQAKCTATAHLSLPVASGDSESAAVRRRTRMRRVVARLDEHHDHGH